MSDKWNFYNILLMSFQKHSINLFLIDIVIINVTIFMKDIHFYNILLWTDENSHSIIKLKYYQFFKMFE